MRISYRRRQATTCQIRPFLVEEKSFFLIKRSRLCLRLPCVKLLFLRVKRTKKLSSLLLLYFQSFSFMLKLCCWSALSSILKWGLISPVYLSPNIYIFTISVLRVVPNAQRVGAKSPSHERGSRPHQVRPYWVERRGHPHIVLLLCRTIPQRITQMELFIKCLIWLLKLY